MIDNKEINARVRDFVIIFKEIPKEEKEKLVEKTRKELQQKLADIDDLIAQNRFDKAIVDLYDIRDTALSLELNELVTKAREKLDQCKALEIEKKKELEEQKIEEDLQNFILDINNLMEKNEFKMAFREIEQLKTTAKEQDLLEFLTQAEELENRCKELEEEFNKEKERLKVEKKVQKKLSSIEFSFCERRNP